MKEIDNVSSFLKKPLMLLIFTSALMSTYGISFAELATSTNATSTSSELASSTFDTVLTVVASSTDTDQAPSVITDGVATSSEDIAAPNSTHMTRRLVHVVGTKYTDYFTDGTTTYSYPGDPVIDANLDKPNAPTPTHGNLVWVSTSGKEAYDTQSGDLELGTYAKESDGSYIENSDSDGISFSSISPVADIAPSSVNVVATSTVSIPDVVSTSTDTTTPQISASTEVSAPLATSTESASSTVSASTTSTAIASSTDPISATSTSSQ